MSRSPIQAALDAVDMRPTGATDDDGGIPTVTHEGVFRFGKHALRVYQLSNGARVFNKDDFDALMMSMESEGDA